MKGCFTGLVAGVGVPLLCGGVLFIVLFTVLLGGAAVQMPGPVQDEAIYWMIYGLDSGHGVGAYSDAASIGVGWDGYVGPGGTPSGVPFAEKPYLNCRFHDPAYPEHVGTDFPMNAGTPIIATMSGKVVWAGYNGAWGNLVVIENDGIQTWYAHLSSLDVVEGQIVKRGTVVGAEGTTGNSTGPHLHYGIKKKTETGQVWLNPENFFSSDDYIKTKCPED